jgi:hypothetical protein
MRTISTDEQHLSVDFRQVLRFIAGGRAYHSPPRWNFAVAFLAN